MSLRRTMLATASLAVIMATLVHAAAGAVVTKQSRWFINGAGLVEPESEKVKCSVGEHPEGQKKLVLTGKIGAGALKITATGIECVNHEGTVGANGTGEIMQTGKAAPNFVAEDRERWKLTGVTVDEPVGCEVKGGTILTNPLKSEIYHDEAEPKIIFKKFVPTSEKAFLTFELVNCAAAGIYAAKGFVFGQLHNVTGVMAVNQPLTFSEAVEATSQAGLFIGAQPLRITGTVNTELAGAHAGQKRGAEEK